MCGLESDRSGAPTAEAGEVVPLEVGVSGGDEMMGARASCGGEDTFGVGRGIMWGVEGWRGGAEEAWEGWTVV